MLGDAAAAVGSCLDEGSGEGAMIAWSADGGLSWDTQRVDTEGVDFRDHQSVALADRIVVLGLTDEGALVASILTAA